MRQACHRGRLLAALLLVAPLGIACHSHSQSAPNASVATPAPLPPSVEHADSEELVALQMANHNWSDVIIYVLRDGQPSRIGVATAASSTSFLLPRRMFGQAGEIQFWGHPIGAAGNAHSESVIVQPGQWIEWTLEDDLDRSATGVFSGVGARVEDGRTEGWKDGTTGAPKDGTTGGPKDGRAPRLERL